MFNPRHIIVSWPSSSIIFLFWILLSDDWHRSTCFVGIAIAIIIPLYADRLDREFAKIGSLRSLPKFFAIITKDIILSNIDVAKKILGPESALQPGFVWVFLDIKNIHGIAFLTSIISLSPGTISAELSEDRRFLLIHALHAPHPEQLAQHIKRRYELVLMEIFP